MRKIQRTASLLTFLEDLEYSEAALGADDETKDLAKPFHDELVGWEDTFKKERASRRNVIRAEAVVAVRNAQLDGKTQQLGASVLAEAGQEEPIFQALLLGRAVFVRASAIAQAV